ncbi:hypothetical protein E2C01_085747 [Portunus trituberculatus]|uniref:Uncharacterized protein n=1 Tax=Portunus trituberculatus TaxID=210409 RepID=A0A5B7J1U5_PORTR|nr:hypothetical protein [Portunus trituberculatus]
MRSGVTLGRAPARRSHPFPRSPKLSLALALLASDVFSVLECLGGRPGAPTPCRREPHAHRDPLVSAQSIIISAMKSNKISLAIVKKLLITPETKFTAVPPTTRLSTPIEGNVRAVAGPRRPEWRSARHSFVFLEGRTPPRHRLALLLLPGGLQGDSCFLSSEEIPSGYITSSLTRPAAQEESGGCRPPCFKCRKSERRHGTPSLPSFATHYATPSRTRFPRVAPRLLL